MKSKKVLILGVGNILLGDEGFGVHAVNYLQKHFIWPDNVQLMDGATLGLMLMDELMGCDLAIILDIAKAGEAPGTFYYLHKEDVPKSLSFGASMHQGGIQEVLSICELSGYCPETHIFCMEPYDCFTMQPQLTESANQKLTEFCKLVMEELAKMGIIGINKN